MRYFFILFFSLFISLSADLIDDYKGNKKVVVVYGENAPESEKKAAQEIYKILELENTGDLFDHIIVDSYALKHQFFYSKFHLIIVGTAKSNILFKNNSEIQLATPDKNSSPIKILPQLNKNKGSFYSAHYGYYPESKGIGFVRRLLNPFTLQSYNLTKGKFDSSPYTATYIGGTDEEGVTKAYINFLDMKMMEGVIIPQQYLGGTNSRFRLSKKSVDEKILETINFKTSVNLGQDTLSYKGWILGATGDYAGIKKLSNVSPEQIVHLKFAGSIPQLMTYDDQVNTVMMINFKNDEDSLKALQGMDKSLQLSLKIKTDAAFNIYSCVSDQKVWYLMRKGKTILIENFSEQWKEPFSKKAADLLK